MRGKIVLAAIAATILLFSWQPVMAQDDEDEQQAWRDDCTDAIAGSMDDPGAMRQVGLSPGEAQNAAKLHGKIVEIFAGMVQLQRYIDNLELLKPVLAGKKNKYALDIVNKIRESARAELEGMRAKLNLLSDFAVGWAAAKCKRKQETGHWNKPSVNLGIGVGIDAGGGDHHHGHHGHNDGDHHKHHGCGPH